MRTLLILATLTAVGFGTVAWLGREPAARMVNTAVVEQGSIASNISIAGLVSGERLVEIAARQPGRVTQVFVDIGDRVQAGAVLAQLDDEIARATLAKASAVAQAARVDRDDAERRLNRLTNLRDASSQESRDEAAAELGLAEARLDEALADLEIAQINVNQHSMVAPFDGVIIERDAEIGKVVAPGWTGAERARHLFTLLDDSQRLIEAHVDSGDSATVAVGDLVTVSSEAYPGVEWTEEIIYVAPVVERELEQETANTFLIEVGLSDHAPHLLFGQLVDLSIRADYVESTLKIPFSAVTAREGAPHVARIGSDGRVRFEPVETGIESLTHVEIVSGLNAGDEVILLQDRLLQPGDLVAKPEQRSGTVATLRENMVGG